MPGKTAGVLDDDDAHAVADYPLKERLEAGPALDRIFARNSRIVEFANEFEPGPLGKAGDGLALARARCPCRRRRWPPSSCAGRRWPGSGPLPCGSVRLHRHRQTRCDDHRRAELHTAVTGDVQTLRGSGEEQLPMDRQVVLGARPDRPGSKAPAAAFDAIELDGSRHCFPVLFLGIWEIKSMGNGGAAILSGVLLTCPERRLCSHQRC